jgi:cell division protein FtsB
MSRGQKTMLALSLASAATLLVHTFVSADGWQRRARVQRDLAAVETDIAAGQRRAATLRAQIEALRSRSEVQERVVRDELGYVRRGDVIVDASAALK